MLLAALIYSCVALLQLRGAAAKVLGVQLVGERVFATGHETLGDDAAAAGTLAQLGGVTGLTYDRSLSRWFAASDVDQK
jgi:hypothetical protein